MSLQDLSPIVRAFRKLGETLLMTALINAIFAVANYLSVNPVIDWKTFGTIVAAQALLAVVLAVGKYFKATGQPLLSEAIEQAASEMIKRSGVKPVVEE